MRREPPANITRLRQGDSIENYLTAYELDLIESIYQNTRELLELIDCALLTRKSLNPIKYPYDYIIAIATARSWPLN